MSRARNLADLLDANGDVASGALDNVPPSNDASALTTGTLPVERVPYVGRRNAVINGGMTISQRGTAFDFPNQGTGTVYTLDRFKVQSNLPPMTFSIDQVNDGPDAAGLSYSLKYTTDVAAASFPDTTSRYHRIRHSIESKNAVHFKNAPCVLSFWVKSSITGQFDVAFFAPNNGANNHYVAPYTINTANTWEKKTISLTGPSAIEGGDSVGIDIQFQLARSGSNYATSTTNVWGSTKLTSTTSTADLATTTGATFYLTGVQFELGSVATPFEHRSFGEELALCRRYYKKNPALQGNFINSTGGFIAGVGEAIQTMRALPTLTLLNGTDAVHVSHISNYTVTGIDAPHLSYLRCSMFSSPGGTTPGHFYVDKIAFDAEL